MITAIVAITYAAFLLGCGFFAYLVLKKIGLIEFRLSCLERMNLVTEETFSDWKNTQNRELDDWKCFITQQILKDVAIEVQIIAAKQDVTEVVNEAVRAICIKELSK